MCKRFFEAASTARDIDPLRRDDILYSGILRDHGARAPDARDETRGAKPQGHTAAAHDDRRRSCKTPKLFTGV